MKNLNFLIAAFTVLTISCNLQSQPWKTTVHGNHNVTRSERTAPSFTGIKASSGIDVYLKQGDTQAITVEADENIQEYILTEVKNGVLHVYTDVNIRGAEKERVYVTTKEISSVSTSSAGDITGESAVTADHLKITASSAGDINLEVYAKDIDVDISSSGNVKLRGETDRLEVDLSSAGDLEAFDLKTKEADVSVSSAGDADINVSDKLTGRASSAGDINYKGNPSYVDVHTSSAGGVHRR